MDYSKIQNGMESIIEALKESNSTSNGVDYDGILNMLDGQSDIMKNFLQGSFSTDMRDGMKKEQISKQALKHSSKERSLAYSLASLNGRD